MKAVYNKAKDVSKLQPLQEIICPECGNKIILMRVSKDSPLLCYALHFKKGRLCSMSHSIL